MRRKLLNLTAASALIMCAAVCLLWALSYVVRDELFWGNLKSSDSQPRYKSLELSSNCGRLMLLEEPGRSRSDGFFWDRYAPNPDRSVAGWTSLVPGIWTKDPDTRRGPSSRAVLVSFWYPAMFFAIGPVWWIVAKMRRQRKAAELPAPVAVPWDGVLMAALCPAPGRKNPCPRRTPTGCVSF
jgi:hypothetical protein